MRRALLVGLMALALVGTACGDDDDHGAHSMSDGRMEGAVMGEPAGESEASREVVVEMLDELAFDPEMIDVQTGEVVTFVVRNAGDIRHEFVLGDEAFQEMHEGDMAGGGHGGGMSNSLVLDAGETGTITWRFTDGGEVLYGCHEPGHYEGGMVGTISVS